MADSTNVCNLKVYVRVKPLAPSDTSAVTCTKRSIIVRQHGAKDGAKEFKNCFTGIFGPDASQDEVYAAMGPSVVEGILRGYNSCIFAYGQTGCFAIDTPIMKFNSKGVRDYIRVQDVRVGDVLMGDDKTPRVVQRLYRGREDMYEIGADGSVPAVIVNASHYLVAWKNSADAAEIRVKDFLKMPPCARSKYRCQIIDESGAVTWFVPRIRYAYVGDFYGFELDGNHRFLGERGLVLRNSGKTHTIAGDEAQPGLMPRLCQALFDQKDQELHIEMSYLELYCDSINDLLNKTGVASANKLLIRQHDIFGIYVDGLKKVAVRSYDDMREYINIANKNRATAATNMNEHSSRSHAVMTLHLSRVSKDSTEIANKLHIIDLAGSEDVNLSGVTGQEMKEMIKINLSLGCLRRVLKRIYEVQTSPNKKNMHIPFFESKLTHILKECLGGNSMTYMIANISSSFEYRADTISTLGYANVASKIVNTATVIERDPQNAILTLRKEIELLREKVRKNTANAELAAELRSMELLYADKERTWETKLSESEEQLRRRDKEIAAYSNVIHRQDEEKKELLRQLNLLRSAVTSPASPKVTPTGAVAVSASATIEDVKRLESLIRASGDTSKYENKILEHVQTIQDLRKVNEELKAEISKKDIILQHEIDRFSQERAALNRQIERLKMRITKMQQTSGDDVDETMLQQYDLLKQKYEEDEQKHNVLLAEMKNIEENILQGKRRFDEIESLSKKAEEKTANLHAAYSELNSKLEIAKKDYDELLMKKTQIQANVSSMKDILATCVDGPQLLQEMGSHISAIKYLL